MSWNAEDRLSLIENRLSKIESRLGILSTDSSLDSGSLPHSQKQSFSVKYLSVFKENIIKPSNFLGVFAVICFVLAAGFIVKLSIESGWLTPIRQISLSALFGLGLIGTGFVLRQLDREYASLLPAAGIVILYLTTFATHRYYSLISFEIAMALVSLVSVLCIFLYMYIRYDLYAVISAAGSYLFPVVLGLNAGAEFSLYYLLLCSVVFSAISIIWMQSRTLTLVSGYLAILTSVVIGLEINQDILVAVILALHFLVFSVGAYLHTAQKHSPLSKKDSWFYFPALLAFYIAEYYFIERINPSLAPWISLTFTGLLFGLYLLAKKYFPDNLGSETMLFTFVTLACFHSVYLELLDNDARSWLFVIIMLGVAFLHFNLTSRKGSLHVPYLAVLTILFVGYIIIFTNLLFDSVVQLSLFDVSFAALASLWCAIASTGDKLSKHETYGYSLLVAAHLLAVTALYKLTADIGSLSVSASWLFYAACVMMFAFIRKDVVIAKSALFVLAFAAGKALLYDAASAPTVVRIGCLLLTGGVMYACGLLMRKVTAWSDQL